MLYSITEKLKKKIYGRLERTLFGERKIEREVQESFDGRTKEFQSSTISKRNEEKIPDPWFN
jgi:hypothetical protein